MEGIKVKQVASHRNGIRGESFSVVTFTTGRGKAKQNMVGIVFGAAVGEDEATKTASRRNCRVAILDVDMLAAGNITFGENSWRGDTFADELFAAIDADWEAWEAAHTPTVE